MVSRFGWSAVSPSRPRYGTAPRAAAVKTGRRPPPKAAVLTAASTVRAWRKPHATVSLWVATLIGDLFGRLPRTADGPHYLRDRRDLGFGVSVAREGDV